MPAIEHTLSIIGFSLLDGGKRTQRRVHGGASEAVRRSQAGGRIGTGVDPAHVGAGSQLRQANVLPFNLPPIIGLSTSGWLRISA